MRFFICLVSWPTVKCETHETKGPGLLAIISVPKGTTHAGNCQTLAEQVDHFCC